MEIIYKGDSIAGGGLSVLSMTKAEYLANQAVYDASDNIIEITDDDDLAISGEQIAFNNTGTGLSADDVQGAIEEVNNKATPLVGIRHIEFSANSLGSSDIGAELIYALGDTTCTFVGRVQYQGYHFISGYYYTANNSHYFTAIVININNLELYVYSCAANVTTRKKATLT